MTTSREWYDSLSEAARDLIRGFCSKWIDDKEPSLFRRTKEITQDMLYYDDDNMCRDKRTALIAAYALSLKNNEGEYLITPITHGIDRDEYIFHNILLPKDLLGYAKEDIYVTHVLNEYNIDLNVSANSERKIVNYIMLSCLDGGFENLDLASLFERCPYISSTLFFDLPKDVQFKLALNRPTICSWATFNKSPVAREVLTDLLSKSDGWTVNKKKDVLYSCWVYEPELDSFVDVACNIDRSLLRFIYTFISFNRGVTNKIYTAKNSDGTYKYPKEVRQLAVIAHCCLKREVSTTMLPRIRNIAGVFELVNYDFNKVFDMMYPEYADESMYIFAKK